MTGTLVYVMGPSGSGKDSLMAYARRKMNAAYALTWNAHAYAGQGLRPVMFIRRHITRPASAGGERHTPLTREAFQSRRKQGQFAMAWESHGLCYGIDRELDTHLAEGAVAVVNGSREYLPEAMKIYPELVPVLISVTPEVLRTRLEKRGRETQANINARLLRAMMPIREIPSLIRLDNSGALENAGEIFADFLTCLRTPFAPAMKEAKETKEAKDRADTEILYYRHKAVTGVRYWSPALAF